MPKRENNDPVEANLMKDGENVGGNIHSGHNNVQETTACQNLYDKDIILKGKYERLLNILGSNFIHIFDKSCSSKQIYVFDTVDSKIFILLIQRFEENCFLPPMKLS